MRMLHGGRGRRVGFGLWCLGWLLVMALLLTPLDGPGGGGADKIAHLLAFGVMAFGAIGFCRRPRTLALLAAGTLAAGVALEAAQGLVPYRSVELADAFANAGGAALGFLAALAVLARFARDAGSPARD